MQPNAEFRQLTVNLDGYPVQIVTKLGLPDWYHISPAVELLSSFPPLRASDNILLFGTQQAALAVVLAHKLSEGHLNIIDTSYVAMDLTRRSLEINNLRGVNLVERMDIPLTSDQQLDAVMIQNPKSRKLLRRWLLHAFQLLKPGGSLYLAGANNTGIQSVIRDAAALFRNFRVLGYKKGHRVAQLLKLNSSPGSVEWSSEPGIVPGSWMEFSIQVTDQVFRIHSIPGVFSYDHLDEGTELLMETVSIPTGARVLDMGCGYGIIGLYALKQGAAWADFVDSDLYAVASCEETLAINQVTHASVYAGDLLEPVSNTTYDLILSNPPFHAGRSVDYQITETLIQQAYRVLGDGGRLSIVANRFIRYDRLIQSIFGTASILAETGKFHVLSGVKSG